MSLATKKRAPANPTVGNVINAAVRTGTAASSGAPGATGATKVQQIFLGASQQWQVPVQTLWGVFGTESGFGRNIGTSSAGARGYMQFEPGTAAAYHVQIGNLASEVYGAAHYLHDLIKQTGSVNGALQRYSGGGGGAYIAKVEANGRSWGGSSVMVGVGASGTGVAGAAGPGGITGAVDAAGNLISGAAGAVVGWEGSLATLLGAIIDPAKWAEYLATVFAWWWRIVWKILWKYAIAPPLHWMQRAVVFYMDQIMGGKDDPKAPFVTISFWALGYGILFSQAEPDGAFSGPARTSPLARTLRAGQSGAARRNLVKPKDVKKNTPVKPKPVQSQADIQLVRTRTVTRTRRVKVEGEDGPRIEYVTERFKERVPPHEAAAEAAAAAGRETHPETPNESGTGVDARNGSGSAATPAVIEGATGNGSPAGSGGTP